MTSNDQKIKGEFAVLVGLSNGTSSVLNVKGAFPVSGGDWQSLILSITEDHAQKTGEVLQITHVQVLPVQYSGQIVFCIPDETLVVPYEEASDES